MFHIPSPKINLHKFVYNRVMLELMIKVLQSSLCLDQRHF